MADYDDMKYQLWKALQAGDPLASVYAQYGIVPGGLQPGQTDTGVYSKPPTAPAAPTAAPAITTPASMTPDNPLAADLKSAGINPFIENALVQQRVRPPLREIPYSQASRPGTIPMPVRQPVQGLSFPQRAAPTSWADVNQGYQDLYGAPARKPIDEQGFLNMMMRDRVAIRAGQNAARDRGQQYTHGYGMSPFSQQNRQFLNWVSGSDFFRPIMQSWQPKPIGSGPVPEGGWAAGAQRAKTPAADTSWANLK